MQNIMGNNMLIAVEAKADYVSAILKVANSALPSKLRYLSAASKDTWGAGEERRTGQVGSQPALPSTSRAGWQLLERSRQVILREQD